MGKRSESDIHQPGQRRLSLHNSIPRRATSRRFLCGTQSTSQEPSACSRRRRRVPLASFKRGRANSLGRELVQPNDRPPDGEVLEKVGAVLAIIGEGLERGIAYGKGKGRRVRSVEVNMSRIRTHAGEASVYSVGASALFTLHAQFSIHSNRLLIPNPIHLQ